MIIAARTRLNVAITAIVAALLLIAFAVFDASLYRGAFLSGWVLLVGVLFLALFGLRRRLTVLPLGSSAAWMQFHLYVGVLMVLVFAEHVGWDIPDGGLEITLAIVFLLVAASGVFGFVLARFLPPRLTRRGEQVIFERIPAFIAALRDETEALVLQSAKETDSSTITEFYMMHLLAFFSGPRNKVRHLIASRRARFRLLNEIENMERYLNPREKEFAERLRDLVIKKDELDFHYSLNLALKAWLLVHVPLTYGLLILAALHLVLVYAFGGGVG